MIKYVTGDMFQSKADCLVNTVNCEGYMGKGIAYQFKRQFPENNTSYVKMCRNKSLTVGKLFWFVENGITIVNFPTKDRWREDSKIQYIEKGLETLAKEIPGKNVKMIAIPPLGCGNGGLDWNIVKPLIKDKLASIEDNYTILIYEPSMNYMQKAKAAPKLSASALVVMKLAMGLKKRSKLRLQKAAFLLNVFSEEPYFSFQRYKYGPYAHSIEIISREIGEFQNYYDLADTSATYEQLYRIICSDKTNRIMDKLTPAVDLAVSYVNQIENDHDLEGISTVLYLLYEKNSQSKDELLSEFRSWSEDKAMRFSGEEIAGYIDYLEETGIVEQDILNHYCLSKK